MLRLVSDENFNGDIVRGLFRRHAELDLVCVQDVGLRQTPDPDILEWAASQGRVLLSHDVSTVPPAAYQRVGDGKAMPGEKKGSGSFIVAHSISGRVAGAEALRSPGCPVGGSPTHGVLTRWTRS